MARIDILRVSLEKKEKTLADKLENHFADVASANGQPLNDKRNGHATMNRWERQGDSIRRQISEIEKTQTAIEREEYKISETARWYEKFPVYIQIMIDEGTLVQWRKYPWIMFVSGVDKARIIFDEKTGVCSHKYVKEITDKEQFSKFRDTYNSINKSQKS